MRDVVIVGAKRTPIGRFLGALSSLPAHQLGRVAIRAALDQSGIASRDVDEVILGQVLIAGQAQNPARQASMAAGLPVETTAWLVNQICGSGLRSVALGMQAIQLGDAEIVVAGGQESMSQSPHASYSRSGHAMGPITILDTMLHDGLMDAFHGYHMGITAENLAEKYSISRAQQDEFAVRSQNAAEAAQFRGDFKEEIAPVQVSVAGCDTLVEIDESIRRGITKGALLNLKPAFKKQGTVTSGNSSGLNDGAAAVVLMSGDRAQDHDIPALAKIVSWATAGVDPAIMGLGPAPAVRKALKKAHWTLAEVDLIEANEAFAAQSLALGRELDWDLSKVNINGGAIALGHPIGASGARVLTTLIYNLRRSGLKRGVATLCVGGGMGVAMCIEC